MKPMHKSALRLDGTLTLGGETFRAPPMTWIDEGVRLGFEPELATQLALDLGVSVVWTDLHWAEFYPAVEHGRVDALLCNQAITTERLARVDFTLPYGLFDEAIIVRKDSGINTAKDLRGVRIAAIAGSTNMAIAQRIERASIVTIDDTSGDVFQTMLDALRGNEIDAFVDDELPLRALTDHPDADLAIAAVFETQTPYGLAVRRGNEPLLEALNGAIVNIVNGGGMQDLWSKWFPDKPFRLAKHPLIRESTVVRTSHEPDRTRQ
jgi:polar amino acid transport system substrate-binding protein